jgi:hypothetical protein
MIGRRGTGRHARRTAAAGPAAGSATVPVAAPAPPAAAFAPVAGFAPVATLAPPVAPLPVATLPVATLPAATLPAAPRRLVRLWFGDGSALALRPDDPLTQAFLAAAEALLRSPG